MDICCRPIIKSDDIEAVVDLHGLIWFTDDRDAIPSHVLIALQHAGSLLLGAFDGDRVIGFSLAFPGKVNNEWILWSHVTGVLPGYQGRGVGRQLKLLQRELALARGYSQIRWTYDPLQAGNANFNISQLGCSCDCYHENFYGEVGDGLNVGLPTDRFEVTWWLAAPPGLAPFHTGESPAPFALTVNAEGKPQEVAAPAADEPVFRVAIPGDINALRAQNLATAIEWRLATRAVFTRLFSAGYVVTGFDKQAGASGYGTYTLRKSPAEPDQLIDP